MKCDIIDFENEVELRENNLIFFEYFGGIRRQRGKKRKRVEGGAEGLRMQ
jgi:hypothetical protein